jgi:hypothetical protein
MYLLFFVNGYLYAGTISIMMHDRSLEEDMLSGKVIVV